MALDALVLLGCRSGPGPLPGAAERRTRRCAEAFHGGVAPLVLVSGGRRWAGVTEAETMARALEERGVPGSALHLERRSLTTRDNARYSAPLLSTLGARRVGLVSCDWHLERALGCFRRAGVEAEPIPAPSPAIGGLARLARSLREQAAWALDRTVMLGW